MQVDLPAIIMYTPTERGGLARYTNELLSALASLDDLGGLQVGLATSRDLAPDHRSAEYPVFDILPPLRLRETFTNNAHWAVSRVVHYTKRETSFVRWIKKQDSCALIHIQLYTPWLAPWHFRALAGSSKKIVCTVHDIRPHKYPLGVPKALFDMFNRMAWRHCDALFVHSESLRDELRAFLGSDRPPITVAPLGAWRTDHGVRSAEAIEERIKKKQLLFFGAVRPNKGLDVLIRAMEQLPTHTLTVAGYPKDPIYYQKVRRLADRCAPGRVTFEDRFIPESEIPDFFLETTLLVLPYTAFESQSGVLHLAISYGVPVVATDVGALGSTVRERCIGIVAQAGHPTSLAEAIADLSDPTSYREAICGLERAKSELSWSNTARITLNTYRSVLQEG